MTKWSWPVDVVRHLIGGTEDNFDGRSVMAVEILIGHCPGASLLMCCYSSSARLASLWLCEMSFVFWTTTWGSRRTFIVDILNLFLVLSLFCHFPSSCSVCAFLGAFAKLRKATISFVMSVCPSAWNNSTPTGRIFVKFDVWEFFENLLKKVKLY